jgi:predicted Kef-type K+ transport protein
MTPVFITIAFVLGFLVRQVGLPPLIGFLAAGFALNALGFEGGEGLQVIADLGVTLLLFSIGLKLQLKNLAKPEVWAGASLHMLTTVVVFGTGIFLLGRTGLPFFAALDLPLAILLAFALSFSSTVFAVKILEEKGEKSAMHGKVSIGILIVQDIFAVIFLTVSLGKIPSAWALLVPLALWGLRPLLYRLADRCGHGELLLLFSLCVALVVGAAGFELVGLKADLGALVLGVLMAGHEKSSEMAKTLLGLKDLFLVGFFLSIGFSGTPSLAAIGVAALLVMVVPLKVALFFTLLTRFKLRARSSLLASLSLANYSEFGLIVAAVGASNGWIGSEWLVIIAVALAISFVIASPLNTAADALYGLYRNKLQRFETPTRHPDDQPIDPGNATIGIFGMGRLGTMAYDFLHDKYGDTVIGFDFSADKVRIHQEAGRRVVYGDPTDPDFWSRISLQPGHKARLIMLAMPKHVSNLNVAKQMMEKGYAGMLAATARFDDQVEELREVGVHAAFNFYNEAGLGFAEHAWSALEQKESVASS